MKIVIDVFGGDHAPAESVAGAVLALQSEPNLTLVLVGDKLKIEQELKNYEDFSSRIEIVHAPEVITNMDVPTVAIRAKKESSLVKSLEYLKTEEEAVALISAGSTGAVLTGGLFKLGRIKGVSRPALCPIMPTDKGGQVALIDCGANVDCKPVHLCHFAIMGSAYIKAMHGIDSPKVALLSNGTEDKKGNELNKLTFPLLKDMKEINFVGNMESRELLSGNFDVAVTDGFAGNICLKAYEGAAKTVMLAIKAEITKGFFNKIGALILKKSFKKVAKRMDYNNIGGALFLGVEKILIKVHGSSKRTAFCAGILQAVRMHKAGVIDLIKQKIENTDMVSEN